MSGNVGSAISKSGMVENVRVAVEIASPSLSVPKLFPLPVCVAATVGSRKCGVAVEITSLSQAVHKLLSLPF